MAGDLKAPLPSGLLLHKAETIARVLTNRRSRRLLRCSGEMEQEVVGDEFGGQEHSQDNRQKLPGLNGHGAVWVRAFRRLLDELEDHLVLDFWFLEALRCDALGKGNMIIQGGLVNHGTGEELDSFENLHCLKLKALCRQARE